MRLSDAMLYKTITICFCKTTDITAKFKYENSADTTKKENKYRRWGWFSLLSVSSVVHMADWNLDLSYPCVHSLRLHLL